MIFFDWLLWKAAKQKIRSKVTETARWFLREIRCQFWKLGAVLCTCGIRCCLGEVASPADVLRGSSRLSQSRSLASRWIDLARTTFITCSAPNLQEEFSSCSIIQSEAAIWKHTSIKTDHNQITRTRETIVWLRAKMKRETCFRTF